MPTTKLKPEQYRDVIAARLSGLSLAEVGERFEITRQRVRQILYRYATDEELGASVRLNSMVGPRAKVRESAQAKKIAEREAILAASPPCRVCGGQPKRLWTNAHTGEPFPTTCSKLCRITWIRDRYKLCLEERKKARVHNAEYMLRSPEKYLPAQLAWAKKIIANGGEFLTSKVGGFGGLKWEKRDIPLAEIRERENADRLAKEVDKFGALP